MRTTTTTTPAPCALLRARATACAVVLAPACGLRTAPTTGPAIGIEQSLSAPPWALFSWWPYFPPIKRKPHATQGWGGLPRAGEAPTWHDRLPPIHPAKAKGAKNDCALFCPQFLDICTSATMGIFPHIKGPARPRNPYRDLTLPPALKPFQTEAVKEDGDLPQPHPFPQH